MAMLTDTPVTTIVLTPRLRRTGSRSVPLIGLRPWVRRRTTSVGSTPTSPTTRVAGVPGSSLTSDWATAPNRRALVLAPLPSGRRSNVAWTTSTPAARAAFTSLASAGIIVSRATAASSGRTDSSPITPFWISDVTTAVRQGATSDARSTAIAPTLSDTSSGRGIERRGRRGPHSGHGAARRPLRGGRPGGHGHPRPAPPAQRLDRPDAHRVPLVPGRGGARPGRPRAGRDRGRPGVLCGRRLRRAGAQRRGRRLRRRGPGAAGRARLRRTTRVRPRLRLPLRDGQAGDRGDQRPGRRCRSGAGVLL